MNLEVDNLVAWIISISLICPFLSLLFASCIFLLFLLAAGNKLVKILIR